MLVALMCLHQPQMSRLSLLSTPLDFARHGLLPLEVGSPYRPTSKKSVSVLKLVLNYMIAPFATPGARRRYIAM